MNEHTWFDGYYHTMDDDALREIVAASDVTYARAQGTNPPSTHGNKAVYIEYDDGYKRLIPAFVVAGALVDGSRRRVLEIRAAAGIADDLPEVSDIPRTHRFARFYTAHIG